MSNAPVVWAITDPSGRVIGAAFECQEDAVIDCKSRNQLIREHHLDMHGDYCRIQSFAFIRDTLT